MPPTHATPTTYRQSGLPERCPRCGRPSERWVFVCCLHMCSACSAELTADQEPVNLVPERIAKD
jgi:uncharacterized protein (DUF983 family)